MSRSARRDLGDFPTPPGIAAVLAREALRGHLADPTPPRILDPACGEGALLQAARAEWRRRRPDSTPPGLVGVEIDPGRARAARAAMAQPNGPRARIVTADALTRPRGLRDGAFDVVIGNPPFLSPTARRGALEGGQRALLTDRLGPCVRPLTNIAAVFLADAIRLVRPGGTVAMILPAPFLTARDACGVRAAARHAGAIEWVWLDGRGAFDAAVDVCAVVLRIGAEQRASVRAARGPRGAPAAAVALASAADEGPWRFAERRPASGRTAATATIGDVTRPMAGFRRHFYTVAAALHEAADRTGRPVVTSGLIDPGRITWGQVPARIAGTRWTAPVVDPVAVDHGGEVPGWMDQTSGTKVLVATQTRVIEAAVDVTGRMVPGVPVIALPADEETAWLLAAALTSPTLTRLALTRHAGAALSADAIKMSGADIAALPLPASRAWWDRGAERLRTAATATGESEWRDALAHVAAAMDRAYRVRAPAKERLWWLGRLPPFRGPAVGG